MQNFEWSNLLMNSSTPVTLEQLQPIAEHNNEEDKVVKQASNHKFNPDKGDRYDGSWVDGKAEGKGVCVFANGDKYDGQWKENRMHGKGMDLWSVGTYCFSNGDKYRGEWKNDARCGRGILPLLP